MAVLPSDYKKYTGALLKITAAALAVFAVSLIAAMTVKGQKAPDVQVSRETYESYYSPNPTASQENEAVAAKPEPAAPSPSPTAAPQRQGAYIVTVYNGAIGVFEPGKSTPFLTADIDVYLLPNEDIALLREGIHADTLSEVRSILEDYR